MSLYDRLGGIYAIAAVVDNFSDRLLNNPIVGATSSNPALLKWHTSEYQTRLAGLKWLRTLWVASLTGGPFQYTGKNLMDAHCHLHIQPHQFDAVVQELANALDYFKVPMQERNEVLLAFMQQKGDVTACSRNNVTNSAVGCPFASGF